MATNFEPHKCTSSVQSTKIGTKENKAIHSTTLTSLVTQGKTEVPRDVRNSKVRKQDKFRKDEEWIILCLYGS